MVSLDLRPADADRGSWSRRVAAQTGFDLRIALRNGENLLLTVVIPVGLLILLLTTPLGDDRSNAEVLVVAITVAVLGTAFTSQAITTGFDRRYGVLRMLGLSPLGSSGLLAARVAVSCCIIAGQVVLLTVVAGLLGGVGFAEPWSWLLLVAGVILGVWTFTGWALFLAGTLRAEATLAVANAVFLLLLFGGGLAIDRANMPSPAAVGLLPSAALLDALNAAADGSPALSAWAVLAVWGLVGTALANRFFRWDS